MSNIAVRYTAARAGIQKLGTRSYRAYTVHLKHHRGERNNVISSILIKAMVRIFSF